MRSIAPCRKARCRRSQRPRRPRAPSSTASTGCPRIDRDGLWVCWLSSYHVDDANCSDGAQLSRAARLTVGSVSRQQTNAAMRLREIPQRAPWPKQYKTACRRCQRAVLQAAKMDRAQRRSSLRGAKRDVKNAQGGIQSDDQARTRPQVRRATPSWRGGN
jgi:ribosomal protein L44E